MSVGEQVCCFLTLLNNFVKPSHEITKPYFIPFNLLTMRTHHIFHLICHFSKVESWSLTLGVFASLLVSLSFACKSTISSLMRTFMVVTTLPKVLQTSTQVFITNSVPSFTNPTELHFMATCEVYSDTNYHESGSSEEIHQSISNSEQIDFDTI